MRGTFTLFPLAGAQATNAQLKAKGDEKGAMRSKLGC